jgi:YfiR/HmsC-like
VLGVMGNDRIADALGESVKDKTAGGRPLTARRVSRSDDLSRLHLLFVGASEKSRILEVMKRVDESRVLTVSDVEGFCELGGVIGLTIEKSRVRFEVNLEAAERSRLKVSSKLLTLARTVHPAKTAGDR